MTTRLSIHDITLVVTSSSHSKRINQLASAIFYGLASFSITIVNKNVLTVHDFPSVQCLVLGQMLTTIIIVYLLKRSSAINLADLEVKTFQLLWPLPLITLVDVLCGLEGTKTLSLPMFTALRRFLLLMTMASEYFIMGVKPEGIVQLSVWIMILGALIAACDDLSFSFLGYMSMFWNNMFSALHAVFIKKKLELASKTNLEKCDIMYYSSLFMFLPLLIVAYMTGELSTAWGYSKWHHSGFLLQFLLSCLMGSILKYSVILCTHYNSALTTSVVGCFKNVCITYVGMAFGYDYTYSYVNFIGINISIAGSFVYLCKSYKL